MYYYCHCSNNYNIDNINSSKSNAVYLDIRQTFFCYSVNTQM